MNKKIKKILLKKDKSKIVSLTAYSKSIAKILDKYVDIVLVGDSMANVLYGHKNTHKLSLENIIAHTISVKMGIKKSLLAVDMPKGSYTSIKKALKKFSTSKLKHVNHFGSPLYFGSKPTLSSEKILKFNHGLIYLRSKYMI